MAKKIIVVCILIVFAFPFLLQAQEEVFIYTTADVEKKLSFLPASVFSPYKYVEDNRMLTMEQVEIFLLVCPRTILKMQPWVFKYINEHSVIDVSDKINNCL